MCVVSCSKCSCDVDLQTDQFARRGDVVTCSGCEWPAKPPIGRVPPKRPADSTQGFTNDTEYGPPYPIHPERLEKLLQQPINPRTKKPYPRDVKKRPSATIHRCDCGMWVTESVFRGSDGVKRIVECGGRGTLFGRYWCEYCNAGHRVAKVSMAEKWPELFDSQCSAELLRQLEKQHVMEMPDKQVTLYLTDYHKKSETQIRGWWKFADFATAEARMKPVMKPAHRKQLTLFLEENPK